MDKYFFTLFLYLSVNSFLGNTLQAQDYLGVSLGQQATTLSGFDEGRGGYINYYFYTKGYTFSISSGWDLTRRKKLFVDLDHSYKGFEYEIPYFGGFRGQSYYSVTGRVTTSSIQVPVRYQYKIRKWLAISPGLYVGRILSFSDTSRFNYLGKYLAECTPKGYHRWESGFNLATVFTYHDLALRLEFQRSLTRSMTINDTPKYFFGFNASIIYYWNLKKKMNQK